MRFASSFIAGSLLLAPSLSTAQRLPPPLVSVAVRFRGAGRDLHGRGLSEGDRAVLPRVAGGLAGGAAGLFAGAAVGYQVARMGNAGGEDPGLLGLILGATFGEALGLVGGTHIAAPDRAHDGDIFLSSGIAVAGLGAVFVTRRPQVFALVPVFQLVALLAADQAPAPDQLPQ